MKNAAKIINEILNLWRWRQHADKTECCTDLRMGQPTQQDKPSPTSSYTRPRLYNLKKEQYAKQNNITVWTVKNTNSMEPLIDDNTIVVAEWINHNNDIIKIGDICIYVSARKDKYIIHQVIDIKSFDTKNDALPKYKFKGINNYFSDGWIYQSDIRYRVFEISWAKQPRDND